MLTRRAFNGAVPALIAGTALSTVGKAESDVFHLGLLGQSLLRHDLRSHPWRDEAQIGSTLKAFDACFSNLECVILGARAGEPTRAVEGVHSAPPEVIDYLTGLGVTHFAASNNHSFDLGTGGILDTIEAFKQRGLMAAGLGFDDAAARAPVYRSGRRGGTVAVVAAAAGMIRAGGAATADRPGVNEIRRESNGDLNSLDVRRILDSITTARKSADLVIAYLHNHYWESEISVTPKWQRQLAREMIDAGASVFVAHGTPLLQGMEMYSGAPLFHGLSSFFFQTRKSPDAYGQTNWQSLIVDCKFVGGRFEQAVMTPLRLQAVGDNGDADFVTRGRPHLVAGADRDRIVNNVVTLSAALNQPLRVREGVAILRAS
jgi:poly-gamma-glutamate synthesis protein (capsule biosynthesis protein)